MTIAILFVCLFQLQQLLFIECQGILTNGCRTDPTEEDFLLIKMRELYLEVQQLRNKMHETDKEFSLYKNISTEEITTLKSELQIAKDRLVEAERRISGIGGIGKHVLTKKKMFHQSS